MVAGPLWQRQAKVQRNLEVPDKVKRNLEVSGRTPMAQYTLMMWMRTNAQKNILI